MWAPRGHQPEVPIVGAMKKVGLTGVLNIQTGCLWQYGSTEYNREIFEEILMNIRRRWRGWNIVLFLDKNSAHTSASSRAYAKCLGIEMRLIPTAASRLNPMEDLWRYVKNAVVANEPTPTLKDTIQTACAHLRALSPRDRLRIAGVLSENFWLQKFVKK
jgi:transposase